MIPGKSLNLRPSDNLSSLLHFHSAAGLSTRWLILGCSKYMPTACQSQAMGASGVVPPLKPDAVPVPSCFQAQRCLFLHSYQCLQQPAAGLKELIQSDHPAGHF